MWNVSCCSSNDFYSLKIGIVSAPRLTGIHHVAINVDDLEGSVDWYCSVLRFSPIFDWPTADFDRRLLGHPSGMILGLTRHKHADAATAFNERVQGLDHLSFGVESRDELDAWAAWLSECSVEHSGVQVTEATGFTLIGFRDPSNIQLELYLA